MVFPASHSQERQHWVFSLIEPELRALGLRVRPVFSRDNAEFVDRIDGGAWELSLDGLSLDNRDAFDFLYSMYVAATPDGGRGLFHMAENGLDDLLVRARGTTQTSEQRALYRQVLEEVARQVPCIPFYEMASFAAASSRVRPFDPGPSAFWRLDSVSLERWP